MRLILVEAPGLDWRLLDALRAGFEPGWFAGLDDSGAIGTMAGFQPAAEEIHATSLARGLMPPEHGVFGALQRTPAGLIPHHAASGHGAALWDHLAAHDQSSIVVNWPGHPALAVRGCWVGPKWLHLADETALSAPELAPPLAPLRLAPSQLDPATLLPFVRDLKDVGGSAELAWLAAAVAQQVSIQSTATHLMNDRHWALLLLRYPLIEQLAPVFMAHTPPTLAGIGERSPWQRVMPAACRLVELSLARLLELSGPDTVMLLASAKGTFCAERRPAGSAPPEAWFHERGLLALSGPGVQAGARIWGAGLPDVLPTALSLLGLPVPDKLPGRVLREALSADLPVVAGPPARPTRAQPIRRAVIVAASDDEAAVLELERQEAMARLQCNDAAGALPLLEGLLRADPNDLRSRLHLARCLHALGQHERARQMVEVFMMEVDHEPRAHLLLGLIELHARRPEHALAHLFRAEQSSPDSPTIHCRIGEAYLSARRPDEARRAFRRALALEPQSAEAHDGLARTCLQENQDEEAVSAALAAIEQDYRLVSAHFHLGVALARLKRYGECLSAFKQCLALAPDRIETHRWLAELHGRISGDQLQAARHRVEIQRLKQ